MDFGGDGTGLDKLFWGCTLLVRKRFIPRSKSVDVNIRLRALAGKGCVHSALAEKEAVQTA